MSMLGWLFLAVGGIFTVVILWLMAPILSLVFEWFAFLFRGLQLAPSWFRSAVWLFIGGLFMQLFVTFFIAGNVVCYEPNGVPVQLTEFPTGYMEAGVAKVIPTERVIDEATQGAIADKGWIQKYLIGSEDELDVPGFGTLVTYAGDPNIKQTVQGLGVNVSADDGIFLASPDVNSIDELLSISPGEDIPPRSAVTMYICGAQTTGTSSTPAKMTGQCAITSIPCTDFINVTLVKVGEVTYDISVGDPSGQAAVGQKTGYTVNVRGSSNGLRSAYATFTYDYYNNYVILQKRTLQNSCFEESRCIYSPASPQYYIRLPNNDSGCIQGEYVSFEKVDDSTSTFLGKKSEGVNPREDFINSGFEVSLTPDAPLPGITYLCDKNSNVDVRLFGLDIGNVTLFYIIFSVVGVVLLQRFMRNY